MAPFTKQDVNNFLGRVELMESTIPEVTGCVLDLIDKQLLYKRNLLMKTTTFENAQVGDKVYDLVYGWGKIIGVNSNDLIMVKFPTTEDAIIEYRTKGNFRWAGKDTNRTLFWDEVKISPTPPEPKRKVKKSLWFNIYKDSKGAYYTGMHPRTSKEEADLHAEITRVACVEGTFEVEE